MDNPKPPKTSEEAIALWRQRRKQRQAGAKLSKASPVIGSLDNQVTLSGRLMRTAGSGGTVMVELDKPYKGLRQLPATAIDGCTTHGKVALMQAEGGGWGAIGRGNEQLTQEREVSRGYPQGADSYKRIKYLYSLVENSVRRVYVGGHQSDPIQIYEAPLTKSFDGYINNQGSANFSVDIFDGNKFLHYDGLQLVWEVTPDSKKMSWQYYGNGFWFGSKSAGSIGSGLANSTARILYVQIYEGKETSLGEFVSYKNTTVTEEAYFSSLTIRTSKAPLRPNVFYDSVTTENGKTIYTNPGQNQNRDVFYTKTVDSCLLMGKVSSSGENAIAIKVNYVETANSSSNLGIISGYNTYDLSEKLTWIDGANRSFWNPIKNSDDSITEPPGTDNWWWFTNGGATTDTTSDGFTKTVIDLASLWKAVLDSSLASAVVKPYDTSFLRLYSSEILKNPYDFPLNNAEAQKEGDKVDFYAPPLSKEAVSVASIGGGLVTTSGPHAFNTGDYVSVVTDVNDAAITISGFCRAVSSSSLTLHMTAEDAQQNKTILSVPRIKTGASAIAGIAFHSYSYNAQDK